MMSAIGRVLTMIFFFFQGEYWSPDQDFNPDPGEFTGLVLARGGSKGIPQKNMAILNGQPLIHYVLESMIKSEVFDSIWVSTDDPEIKNYVLTSKKGVKVHDRAAFTATDEATSLEAIQEFQSLHPEAGAIGLVQATSPFLQPSYLKTAKHLFDSYKLDSMFSVTRQRKLRWSEVTDKQVSSGRWSTPLNFDPRRRPRRQDWPGELIENGMFYFMRKKNILEGVIQGKRSYYVEIPIHHGLEIDTPEDLILANILMNSSGFSKEVFQGKYTENRIPESKDEL